MADQRLLTVRDLAERFGVREVTARAWLTAGRIPAARKEPKPNGGTRWVVPEAALVGWSPPRRGSYDRDAAARLRQAEAERDRWRCRAEIARAGLERIAGATGRFDHPDAPAWQRAAAIARAALERLAELD